MKERVARDLSAFIVMKCIFLFRSVHHVIKAEKLLKGKGIKVDLIPVPREVSSDCGVAIELSVGFKEEALNLLEENHVSILDCYVKNKEQGMERG